MRRNSGTDEGRDNLLDPTTKEHEAERGKSGAAVIDRHPPGPPVENQGSQKSTAMGSHARKTGGKGDTN